MSQRVITALPLRELWDDRGPVSEARSRDLTSSDIRDLLRLGPVRFVVADVGAKPVWVLPGECFTFWKAEVKAHLADPQQRVFLDEFPDAFCYFASEWLTSDGPPVVVFEALALSRMPCRRLCVDMLRIEQGMEGLRKWPRNA